MVDGNRRLTPHVRYFSLGRINTDILDKNPIFSVHRNKPIIIWQAYGYLIWDNKPEPHEKDTNYGGIGINWKKAHFLFGKTRESGRLADQKP